MVKQRLLILSGALVITMAGSAQAHAEDPKLIASHGQWSAYEFVENKKKVCYILSQPSKAEGKYGSRGEIYALITNRPADSSRNVFSYIAGYPYKPGSDVSVKIDAETFTLFTQDDTAWAPDAVTDDKIAKAMSKGSKMIVKGTSARGTDTVDTYSLEGSGTAHKEMEKECDSKE